MFLNTESRTRVFETEQDGVNYRMISWGRYLRVAITNNSNESVRIGGEYKLQRMIDGNFTDIDDSRNICYGGTYVSEMPVIKLTNEGDGNEIVVDNNEFTIDPGQTIEAQFITMQYAIDDSPEFDGEYRFIYGDAVGGEWLEPGSMAVYACRRYPPGNWRMVHSTCMLRFLREFPLRSSFRMDRVSNRHLRCRNIAASFNDQKELSECL